jgi:hypothetical protein
MVGWGFEGEGRRGLNRGHVTLGRTEPQAPVLRVALQGGRATLQVDSERKSLYVKLSARFVVWGTDLQQ